MNDNSDQFFVVPLKTLSSEQVAKLKGLVAKLTAEATPTAVPSSILAQPAGYIDLGATIFIPRLNRYATVLGYNNTRNHMIIGYTVIDANNDTSIAHDVSTDQLLSDNKRFANFAPAFPSWGTIPLDEKVELQEVSYYHYDANKEHVWKNKEGQSHREDGPAIIGHDGVRIWCKNNRYHREDGPACEYKNGEKHWYVNGQRHRENGPAIEYADGKTEYWVKGIQQPKEQVKDNWTIDSEGTKKWLVKGQLHRTDGPALIKKDGSQEWYLNNQRHRENAPAMECANGDKHWYLNGQKHRIDGPAIIDHKGTKNWAIYGKLHRMNGPAIEHTNGDQYWYQNNQLHREDGPAVIKSNGFIKEYYQRNQLHREDGPAVEWKDGYKEYYRQGVVQWEKASKTSKTTKNKTIPSSFVETFYQDTKSAGYRIAATQINQGLNSAIVSLLEKTGSSSTAIKTITEMLQTPYGLSVISFLLGTGLEYSRLEDPRLLKIGEELRIGAMAGVGNTVITSLIEALVPVVKSTLQQLPEQQEVRIATDTNQSNTPDETYVEEEIKAPELSMEVN